MLLDHSQSVPKLCSMQSEVKQLEEKLVQLASQERQGQCLVTRLVDLSEVRRNIQDWRMSIKEEYESLKSYGAIQPISAAEFRRLERSGEVEVDVLPSKLVATQKTSGKLRARIVGCGNLATNHSDQTSAGGLDTVSVRAVVSEACHRSWDLTMVDVKTAFLQAPRRQTPGRVTVVSPPSIVKECQVLEFGSQEYWIFHGALYGLVESPADWSCHRDGTVRLITWNRGSKTYRFAATPEAHLWKVIETETLDEGSASTEKIVGYMGVYVDDLLVAADETMTEQILEELGKRFTLAKPEKVGMHEVVSFCGYEVRKVESGYQLQSKYVQELLSRYQVDSSEKCPCPKITDEEDEEMCPQALKTAQALTGELSWIASRTRPDLAFVTGVMSRLLHRRLWSCWATML